MKQFSFKQMDVDFSPLGGRGSSEQKHIHDIYKWTQTYTDSARKRMKILWNIKFPHSSQKRQGQWSSFNCLAHLGAVAAGPASPDVSD